MVHAHRELYIRFPVLLRLELENVKPLQGLGV